VFFLISAFYIWGAIRRSSRTRLPERRVLLRLRPLLYDPRRRLRAVGVPLGHWPFGAGRIGQDFAAWSSTSTPLSRDPRRRLRAVGDAQRNFGDLPFARTCTLNFRPPVPVVSDKNPRGPPAPRGLVRPHPRGLPALRGPSILVQPGLVDRGHHLADSGILLYFKSFRWPTIYEGFFSCPSPSWSR